MKKTKLLFQALLVCTLLSCEDNITDRTNNTGSNNPPAPEEFTALQDAALEAQKQTFTFNTSSPTATFTSANGVEVVLNTGCLTKNGQPVTGSFTINFIEMFSRGDMLAGNKPTMGNLGPGVQRLLISGGEFYINALQDGTALDTNCGIMISVPTNLTGGQDNDMEPFLGSVDNEGNVIWDPTPAEFWIGNNNQQQPGGTVFYNALLNEFGWFNCDKFAGFIGPFTAINVLVPGGYNDDNSNIFIAVAGEPNALGTLSGQYPVGLDCYIIFVTADGEGNWRYAVKTVTLTQDATYTFTEEELQTVTQAQLIAAINALP